MEEAGLHIENNAYDAGQLVQAFDLENLPEDFYASPYRHYDALREGAPMKRLAGTAIAGLLARFPAFALDGEHVHGRRARFRGYSRIPVRVG